MIRNEDIGVDEERLKQNVILKNNNSRSVEFINSEIFHNGD